MQPPFERLVNAVHQAAPVAAIAFNPTPQDRADAAARWLHLAVPTRTRLPNPGLKI
jgi:hypothetical protein